MLSVLGIGMVSASGARARDHAFYVRAEAPPPVASPFYRVDGRRWEVRRCPWVGPLDSVAARMLELAKRAASEALGGNHPNDLALYLCMPAARAGLTDTALADLSAALAKHVRARSVTRLVGEAAVLGALESMSFEGVALVVAVDGFVSLADATESVQHPPCPWLLDPLTPGEGAGALLLTKGQPQTAIARIVAASSAVGAATDDNDEPIDAVAMSDVMRRLSAPQIAAVFGQGRVDHLRLNEWERMVPRLAERFHMTHHSACLEAEVGRTGSASGVMSLCYAIACLRHRALPRETPEGAVIAWALSRDGLRAVTVVESDRPDALVALDGAVRARRVDRNRFAPTPPEIEDDEEDFDEDFDEDQDAAAREIEELLEAEKAVEEGDDIAPMPRLLPSGVEPLPLVTARELPILSLDAFYDGVVVHCAETAAMLAQDRFEGPWSEVAETERRLLCQIDAVVATGGNALSALVRGWESDIEDAWSAYANTLLLLAFAGEDVVPALMHAIAQISDDDVGAVRAVSEAIALSDPQHAVMEALREADEAPARAIGIALGGLGAVDPQAVAQALTDESLLVRRAAVWACDALPPEEHRLFAPYLEAAFDFPEGYSAARQLALWGDPSGVARLDAFGPMGAELLVLAGRVEDAPALEHLLQREEPSAQLIDSVARFGSPRSLPWLLGLLVHADLAEAASAGLATFLGPIERALDRTAWQAVIDAMALDPARRYRRGRPWTPAVVADECAIDGLSRIDLEKRSDELRARLGIAQGPRLWCWHPDSRRELDDFLAVARARR